MNHTAQILKKCKRRELYRPHYCPLICQKCFLQIGLDLTIGPFFFIETRPARDHASIMCSNGCVGCCIGSGNIGDDSGDVDEVVAKGPKNVLKQYIPLFWLNSPLYRGGGVGGGGGSDIFGDV